jgi:hypothetical protein
MHQIIRTVLDLFLAFFLAVREIVKIHVIAEVSHYYIGDSQDPYDPNNRLQDAEHVCLFYLIKRGRTYRQYTPFFEQKQMDST